MLTATLIPSTVALARSTGQSRSGGSKNMPTHSLNSASLSRLLEALRLLRDFTGNAELQLPAMAVFVYVSMRHPTEVPYGEIEKTLNLGQTSVSRNTAYLAKGDARGHGGYKLIDIYEDEFYRRRKLCKLTKKGEELAAKMSALLAF